jgi:signal transduction histidine kinase/DNA-binding response OmpR family regulator/HPt (histidine-containing phosphotransfer) domain-containing protein
MLNFERSSLSKKLSLLPLLCTAAALLVVFAAFAVSSIIGHRHDAQMQLQSFAALIGQSSIGALRRHDWQQAAANLEALDSMDGIAGAALYDPQGRAVARYGSAADEPLADTSAATLQALNVESDNLLRPHMRHYHVLRAGAELAGVVMVESNLAAMWRDIAQGMAILGAAMAGALVIATPLAARLKSSITEPVAKLIVAARRVSEGQNYAQRIAHTRSDELGELIDSFNTMLAQIEERGSALAHHRTELEHQVSVRTEQLEKAKNAAEAASRAKSAFLATMSHEIRTPMNGVLGMTEMLLGTALTETQRSYASMVRRSGEHLLVIINDILDFSKIEAGKLTIEYIHFSLWDLLDDIDSVYRPQAHAKGISLYLDADPALPLAVLGDPNRLRQVLSNLLGNAIKFTDSGEIHLRVRITREDEQACGLRVEVQDTGIGISREARSRIFEAFSQADNSTTRKYGGTGLGLAISKQLIELMGGKIGVENALTQGSVCWFQVTFDKRRADPGALDDDTLTRLRGLRVLIVDDQAASRSALARQLEAWQVRADATASGYEAGDLLRAAADAGQPYHAALLDMDQADISGLALAAELRADPALAAVRLILLSHPRSAADPTQRRAAGVACQLTKPPRPGDLFECLLPRAGALPQPAPAPASPLPAPPSVQTAHTRRRSVLLAEDNPVNVEVATAMLASLGFEVHGAANGGEALAAVRAGTYDLVLMDCQMPVMDGFAATAEIRRHEQKIGGARKLPIIAITANALQGDREACLAAGMDDYLSKPFSQQQLAAVLGRWVALPLAAAPHHPDLPPAPAPERARVNPHALANIRALAPERGDLLVRRVVDAWCDDTPLHLAALHEAITGGDPAYLRRTAHSLKSSSANVGAEAMARLCRDLESLGRTDTTEGAAGILTDMEREFDAVRASLAAMLEKES